MPELHPLAQAFDRVAAEYERGRPGYPPEVVAALGLPAGARVADVGAGTGKLTRALAAAGLDVVAVEPLAGMRAALAAAVPGVEVRPGVAEALPLEDASVDAVTAADAFHWFDMAKATPELARVIRPGGALILLTNTLAGEAARQGAAWAAELIDLLDAIRPEHPAFQGDRRDTLPATGRFGPWDTREVVHVHRATRASLIDNIASISYISQLPDAERTALLARVDHLLARHGVEAVDQPLRTTIQVARRLMR
jgi:SAM-dependent methyltransferase